MSVSSDHLFDPFNPAHIVDAENAMEVSRRKCPVGQVNDNLYTLNSDAAVREVFEDATHFSNKGNFAIDSDDVPFPVPVITMADPPYHTALRSRLLKDLSPARLRTLAPKVEAIVDTAIKTLPKAGRVDLYADFVHFIPAAVVYSLIGIPEHAWIDVQAWSDVIVDTVPEPVGELPELASLIGFLASLVEDRRARPSERRDDVLDNLCFAEPGEADMSTVEVSTHIFQLVAAGTDTTRSLIVNCLYRLLEHRDSWTRLLRDRSLLINAIEESLRLDSPAQFMIRSVVDDVSVESCPMRSGRKAYLNIQSANHDEQRWGEDSRNFRIDRRNAAAHLAFGRGIHACIGAPLARIEARMAIAALMDAYPDMRLAPEAEWVTCPGAISKRVQSVPVLLTGEN